MSARTSTGWFASSGRTRAEDLLDDRLDIDRRDTRGSLRHDPDRGEDRVDEAIEALDLFEGRAMPRGPRLAPLQIARLAPDQGWFLGQEVGVRADHGERRAQLVGHEGDQFASGFVDGLERLDPRLGLRLLAALLHDAREQVRDRAELIDVRSAELPRALRLDVEHADRLVVPRERDRQHRGHEAPLVDAADPQEARIGLHVRDDEGLLRGGDAARDALAERDAGPADLVPVEAVGRRERQVRSVPVQQVEGGHVRVQGVARAIDDRLEQFVPGPSGRGQAQDLVQEAQLVELVSAPRRRARPGLDGRGSPSGTGPGGRHGHHLTSVGKVGRSKGCGRGKVANRYGPQGSPS